VDDAANQTAKSAFFMFFPMQTIVGVNLLTGAISALAQLSTSTPQLG
jgi:hypothetical protein